MLKCKTYLVGVAVFLLSLCTATAEPIETSWPPPRVDDRIDLAEAGNGGRIWISENRDWKVRPLNSNETTKSWESEGEAPVEITVKFLGQKEANIDKIVFVPQREGVDGWPRKVVLLTSEDGNKRNKIGEFQLPAKPGRHVIDIADCKARFFIIRIVSTVNDERVRLARIHVLESPKSSIITYSRQLKEEERSLSGNLLSGQFGGTLLEGCTNGVKHGNHAALSDGKTDDPEKVFVSDSIGVQEARYSLLGELGIATDRLIVNHRGVKAEQRVREIIVKDYSLDEQNPEVLGHFVLSPKLERQVLPLKRRVLRRIGLSLATIDGRTPVSVADLALFEAVPPGETSLLDNALAQPAEKQDAGVNLLSFGLGARVFSGTDPFSEYPTTNLLHGQGETKGWTALRNKLPAEMVFEVAGGKAAVCDRMVFNTRISPTFDGILALWTAERNKGARIVTVSVSQGAGGPFDRLGIFLLRNTDADQVVRFKPTSVRFLKLTIADNHGSKLAGLRFVRLIEKAAPGASLLERIDPNIAQPALGGGLLRFTSQPETDDFQASNILDGDPTTNWVARDASLPQDFVFGFRKNMTPSLESVIVRYPADRPNTPVEVRLATSNDSVIDDFKTIGFYKLSGSGEDRLRFKAVAAKYLLVRITKTADQAPASLSEIAIHEMKRDGYRSIVIGNGTAVATTPGVSSPTSRRETDEKEQEPNNVPAEANRLTFGKTLRGTIDPKGEVDHFVVDATGKKGVLTLEMDGEPILRTSLLIKNEDGKTLHQFDPALATQRRAVVSWAVDGGKYHLSVTEPKVSLVLACDNSGSMENDWQKLDAAVNTYVSNVTSQEQVAVLRFHSEVELLSEFTSDVELLKKRTKDKFEPMDSTALYDAIEKSLNMLSGRTGNRAIVLMSDGSDSVSDALYEDTWEKVARAGVRIYTVCLGAGMMDYNPQIGNTPLRYLHELSKATGGRHYFTRDSKRLDEIYQEIAGELRSTSDYVLKPSVSTDEGTLSVVQLREPILGVSAPQRVLLIFDCSQSMLGPIQTKNGSQRKMNVARDVLKNVIDTLPPETQVGLRVYGRRTAASRRDCKDTELLVQFGQYRKTSFKKLLDLLQPNGMTPIAYTLQQVAGDFEGVTGKKLVILVTDGEETCNGDPVAVAKNLVDNGLDVQIHVVGFDIKDDNVAKKQLAGIANAGHGKLFLAKNATALKGALEELLRAPFQVEDSFGQTIAKGIIGQDPIKVPTGNYRVRITSQPEIVVDDVRIQANSPTRIELTKQGDKVETEVH